RRHLRARRRRCALTRFGSLAVERLPKGDAEAENVATLIRFFALALLGSHVCRRSENRTGMRRHRRERIGAGRTVQVRVRVRQSGRRGRDGAGKAEVGHAHAPVNVAEDVFRLEITMDDADRVRGGETLARTKEHVEEDSPRAWLAAQPFFQAYAVD